MPKNNPCAKLLRCSNDTDSSNDEHPPRLADSGRPSTFVVHRRGSATSTGQASQAESDSLMSTRELQLRAQRESNAFPPPLSPRRTVARTPPNHGQTSSRPQTVSQRDVAGRAIPDEHFWTQRRVAAQQAVNAAQPGARLVQEGPVLQSDEPARHSQSAVLEGEAAGKAGKPDEDEHGGGEEQDPRARNNAG